jgi:hypothetical protein
MIGVFIGGIPLAVLVYAFARGSSNSRRAKLRGLAWVGITFALIIGLGQLSGGVVEDEWCYRHNDCEMKGY